MYTYETKNEVKNLKNRISERNKILYRSSNVMCHFAFRQIVKLKVVSMKEVGYFIGLVT